MDGYLARLKELEENCPSTVPFVYFNDHTAGVARSVLVGKNLLALGILVRVDGISVTFKTLREDISSQSLDEIVSLIAKGTGYCMGGRLNYETLKVNHPTFDLTKADIWTIVRLEAAIKETSL